MTQEYPCGANPFGANLCEVYSCEENPSGMYPPLVFLDIDGVLNSLGGENVSVLVVRTAQVELLNRLIAALSKKEGQRTRVAISSGWRLSLPFRTIVQKMVGAGFKYPKRVIGDTPIGSSRQNEIGRFLMDTGWPIDRIVVLDDERNLGRLSGRHIRTDSKVGLTERDVARALCLF
jgi:hypothetical protein